jgi:EAL domain-containing protein (putative c-di-GMP-specific phosphodiesterase class I)
LKIDRNFIKDAMKPGGSLGIVRAIAMMGREMHLQTIAEGIETEHQLKMLQKLKCDAGQGFYLSKPVSSQDVAKLLEAVEKA